MYGRYFTQHHVIISLHPFDRSLRAVIKVETHSGVAEVDSRHRGEGLSHYKPVRTLISAEREYRPIDL